MLELPVPMVPLPMLLDPCEFEVEPGVTMVEPGMPVPFVPVLADPIELVPLAPPGTVVTPPVVVAPLEPVPVLDWAKAGAQAPSARIHAVVVRMRFILNLLFLMPGFPGSKRHGVGGILLHDEKLNIGTGEAA